MAPPGVRSPLTYLHILYVSLLTCPEAPALLLPRTSLFLLPFPLLLQDPHTVVTGAEMAHTITLPAAVAGAWLDPSLDFDQASKDSSFFFFFFVPLKTLFKTLTIVNI